MKSKEDYPQVTVLMPLYKRASGIKRAYESIVMQTMHEWELLLLQDGDDEEVRRVASGITATDRRVRHLHSQVVGNIGQACNRGLRIARGKYIAILDDDDEWIEPLKLSRQVRFLDVNRDYVACGSGYESVTSEGRALGRVYKPQSDRDIRRVALIANPIANSTSMFRRESALEIGGYDETLRDFQDWDFWLRSLGRGKLFNFHSPWVRYTLWERGSSFLNIRSNAASAKRIVRRYAPDFEHAWRARVLVTGYCVYARMPFYVRRLSFVMLSQLKKRLLSVDRPGNMPMFRRELPDEPTVCVVIPSLGVNEHTVAMARSLVRSGKGSVQEVFVVDGLDPTVSYERIESFDGIDLVRLGNPSRFKSQAVNRAIARTGCDLVLIADTRCSFAPDYVVECINAIKESGALNVGGAQRYRASGLAQYALAISIHCILGSGGAKYKDAKFSGFAETVYLGCFLRSALLEVSRRRRRKSSGRVTMEAFSEMNVANQDAEVNFRLAELSEFPVYISDRIQVWYTPRQQWNEVVVQYFRYGRGRCLTSVSGGKIFSRGNMPFVALIVTLCVFSTSFVTQANVGIAFGFLCLTVLAADVYRVVYKSEMYNDDEIWAGPSEEKPKRFKLAMCAGFALVGMIVSHGLGFGYQLLRIAIRRRLEW